MIGFVDGAKRTSRRGPPASLAGLADHDLAVRYIALAKQPDFTGVDLLVAAVPDSIVAAECAVRRRIPLLFDSDDDLSTLVDDLDRLSLAWHTMLTVKLDGRGERLVVARSSRSGDRLIVSCDGGTYRGIAQEVKVHSTEQLPLARLDPADHD